MFKFFEKENYWIGNYKKCTTPSPPYLLITRHGPVIIEKSYHRAAKATHRQKILITKNKLDKMPQNIDKYTRTTAIFSLSKRWNKRNEKHISSSKKPFDKKPSKPEIIPQNPSYTD